MNTIIIELDQDDSASLVSVLEEDNWDKPDCQCFRCGLSRKVRKKAGMITRHQHKKNIQREERRLGLTSSIVPHDPNRQHGITYASIEPLTVEELDNLFT